MQIPLEYRQEIEAASTARERALAAPDGPAKDALVVTAGYAYEKVYAKILQ